MKRSPLSNLTNIFSDPIVAEEQRRPMLKAPSQVEEESLLQSLLDAESQLDESNPQSLSNLESLRNLAGIKPLEIREPMAVLPTPDLTPDKEVIAQAKQDVENQSRQPASQPIEQQAALPAEQRTEDDDQKSMSYSDALDLIRAGQYIGAGLGGLGAGRVIKPDTSLVDSLQQNIRNKQQDALVKTKADQESKLKDLELATEQEKADPDSLISQVYRSAAQKIGIQVPEKATARSLEAIIGKNILGSQSQGKLIRVGTTPDGRPVAMNTASGEYQIGDVTLADSAFTSKDPQTGETLVLGRRGGGLIKKIGSAEQVAPEQKEVTYKNLNPKQKEVLNKTQEQVKKDEIVAGGREALVAADNALLLLNQGKTQGQDIVRAIQNMLSRATGERGVMTEADVAPFGGSAAVLDRLQRYGTVALKGKLPEEDRKFLTDFATSLRSAAQNRVSSGAAPFIRELSDKVEVTPENAAKLLSIEELSNKKSSSGELGGPASTVKIKDTKSGKVKMFSKEKADEILKKDADDKLNRFILVD